VVLTAVSTERMIFCAATACSSESSRRFGATHCPYIHGRKGIQARTPAGLSLMPVYFYFLLPLYLPHETCSSETSYCLIPTRLYIQNTVLFNTTRHSITVTPFGCRTFRACRHPTANHTQALHSTAHLDLSTADCNTAYIVTIENCHQTFSTFPRLGYPVAHFDISSFILQT
jgi:hypothetical protein